MYMKRVFTFLIRNDDSVLVLEHELQSMRQREGN